MEKREGAVAADDYTSAILGDSDSDSSASAKPRPPGQSRKDKVRKAGASASAAGQATLRDVQQQASARSAEPSPNSSPRYVDVDSYKRGGKVKRSGKSRLHKGERVVKRGKRKRMSGRS